MKLSFNPEYENCSCNYCGSFDFKTLSKKDRYGLNAITVICKKCGLIFINPRMDKKSYGLFYENFYRKLLQKYKNRETEVWNLDRNFLSSKKFGEKLAISFKNYINRGLIIEIGSSTGGVLAGFKSEIPDLEIIGIEPSKEESDFANSKGVKTITSMFENLDLNFLSVDNIIIIRSINHLLDPGKFFAWAYKNLKPKGKLIIVALDFLESCKKRGMLTTQIDHPFMFSQDTLANFVESNGFKIIFNDLTKDSDYIKLIAEKTDTASQNKKIDKDIFLRSSKKLNPIKLRLNYIARKVIKN